MHTTKGQAPIYTFKQWKKQNKQYKIDDLTCHRYAVAPSAAHKALRKGADGQGNGGNATNISKQINKATRK